MNGKNRPRFRYGSGKWEKAVFQLQIQSSVTGRTLNAFALPNPEEVNEEWFQDHMLVPVLVGMDFLRGNGMIVDFSDGLSVCTAHEGAQPFHLPMNHKEHYMIDFAEFLVDGKEDLQGHPEINIIFYEEFQEAVEQQQFLDMFPLTFDLATLPMQSTKSERQLEFFTSFWKRHQSVSSLQHTRLMGNLSTSASARPSTSPIAVDGSEVVEDRSGGETMGLGPSCSNGPLRSEESEESVAMHGKPMKWHSNKWAQWRHCGVCALRLDYVDVPSLGSPANSTSQPNPGTVAQALAELKNMMDPLPPTESMVRVMIDKVTAEHRLSVMMDQHKMEMENDGKGQRGQADVPKGALKGKQGVFEARSLRRTSSRTFQEFASGLVSRP